MLRQFLLSLFVGIPLLTCPVLADLMDISLTGSVGASGGIGNPSLSGIVCAPDPLGGFSFSQSMTQLGVGSYVLDSSGQETCMSTSITGGSSVSGTAQQIANVTANNVSVTNVINGGLSNGLGPLFFDTFSQESLEQLSFDLGVPTIMDLIASATIACTGLIPDCFSNPGTLSINGANLTYLDTIHTIMTLEPGSYFIEDMASTFAGTSAFAEVGSTLSFNADFTPIPEPRGFIVLLVVLAVLLCRLSGRSRPQQWRS